jgi:hypothetical protein
LIEKEILNRLAVLILRGAIKDGEIARVVLEDGRIMVLPNHTDEASDVEIDEEMTDGEDALAEIDDTNGTMDLYE